MQLNCGLSLMNIFSLLFVSPQMSFIVKSLEQDVLCITVFDRDLFSPNGKVISDSCANFHLSSSL